ncbi:MAG: M23 family metallopeptidase [Oscillospiraceae bacterium]|nr:M23 family metallopeptidase [Oscillospiraceae bacterium]
MSNRHYRSGAKGYYIALILCAVAIGICGYMYYRNADTEPQLQNPEQTIDVLSPSGGDVQAVATQPQPLTPDNATQPTIGQKPPRTKMPVSGQTVASYAMDCLSYNVTTRDWRTHNGIDIAAEAGTQVTAAADGLVSAVYQDETMGATVVISHEGGYTTTYSSLDSELSVQVGDTVEMGSVIGCVGSSALLESALGDHVHFSVSCNGISVDPLEFLEQE